MYGIRFVHSPGQAVVLFDGVESQDVDRFFASLEFVNGGEPGERTAKHQLPHHFFTAHRRPDPRAPSRIIGTRVSRLERQVADS